MSAPTPRSPRTSPTCWRRPAAAAESFDEVRGFLAREGLDLRLIQALAGSLVLAKCTFTPAPRRFRLDAAGELSAIVEAIEIEAGERWLVDLVAWPIARPAEFASVDGRAVLLGGDEVDNPASYFGGRPLPVHRTPTAWLRAGCRGVVPLDENRAWIRLAGALGRLAAEDEEHARELARMCAGMFSPRRIVFPRLGGVRAA